jgi:hypothetical protein
MSNRYFSALIGTFLVSYGVHATAEESGCVSTESFAWPDISLRLGKVEQRRPVYRINAGRMSPKMEKTVEVRIHNYLDYPIYLRAPSVDGNVRSASWGSEQSGDGGQAVAPNQSALLKMVVFAGDPTVKGHVQLADRCGSFISLISVRYREVPSRIHGRNTATAWSGQRKHYSETAQYACLGPAPLGYRKIPGTEKYALSGHRTVCKSWLNCFEEKLKADEVCFGASPQGEEDSNGQFPTYVTVEADYELVGSAPWLWK